MNLRRFHRFLAQGRFIPIFSTNQILDSTAPNVHDFLLVFTDPTLNPTLLKARRGARRACHSSRTRTIS